ncbi:MAG: WecB/TagA/CpsF family glycosyltransferase [Verrucomicrobiota bacterium]
MQPVLGTPLLLTDYDALGVRCAEWVKADAPVAVDFTNTHIVTSRRHNPAFRRTTEAIDYFVPDGMPLVWCLNRLGAGLNDRVYGPTFMRQFLTGEGRNLTHYLIGGSAECGERLKAAFPGVKFVGGFHGRCLLDGHLEGKAEFEVRAQLEQLAPDCIWVGLGTPKQYFWIERHKALLKRGVVLAVGFAFDVNAGTKKDAPPWMQRAGLTWLFRLGCEPARLGPRYLKYSSLFLAYLLREGLRGASLR